MLQTEKDNLLRQKGSAETRAKRLTKIQGQLKQIDDLEVPEPAEIINAQAALQAIIEAMEINAREITQAAVENQTFPVICPAITLEQIPCPKAGQIIGVEPPAPGVMAALVQTRQGLIARHSELMTTYSEATDRAESYRDGMAKKEDSMRK